MSAPRAETIRSGGTELGPAMGTATALNFQPTGGGKAAINGDFVMTAGEVDNVIRALREGGIEIVAGSEPPSTKRTPASQTNGVDATRRRRPRNALGGGLLKPGYYFW